MGWFLLAWVVSCLLSAWACVVRRREPPPRALYWKAVVDHNESQIGGPYRTLPAKVITGDCTSRSGACTLARRCVFGCGR